MYKKKAQDVPELETVQFTFRMPIPLSAVFTEAAYQRRTTRSQIAILAIQDYLLRVGALTAAIVPEEK